MSTVGVPIYFDDRPPIDQVVLAVAPIDAFSGRLVASGVKAMVKGLLNRPIKNISGHLVFVNLPVQREYTVIVDASEAGYLSPPDSTFKAPAAGEPSEKKRHVVKLTRRTDFAFEDTTTLVRGTVVRGKKTVEGALIWTSFPRLAAFETLSDARGTFALPFTAPPNQPIAGGKLSIRMELKHGVDHRVLSNLQVIEGKPNIFTQPIDLSGTNTPPFFDPYQH